MINIKEYDGNSLNGLGKYVARVELVGTVVESLAPFTSEGPHALGYGPTPESALDDAYRKLGRCLALKKENP
jgi:hypothetical protein